jgi:hypothetical protein
MAPTQPASRSRFWLGFALAFGLLMLASCSAFLITTGLDEVSLAELQGSGPAWTPPPTMPTPQEPAVVSGSDAVGLENGLFGPEQTVRNVTNSRVNVRATAGYLAKPATDVIAQLQPGEETVIVGPSAQADGLTWWLVRQQTTDGRVIEGWVAQATASGVTILGE